MYNTNSEKCNEEIRKKVAAYALNLWTVSVSQIVEYNDVNIMEQEYDNIMNNLNLENMPKDEALLEIIKAIMDEITNLRIDEGDRKIVEIEYQNRVKNNIWNAVPSVGAIFSTSNPVALGITLATQVGMGYMSYRKNKAQNELEHEKAKWQIQKNRLQHLNGLQQQLFETAWRLSDSYGFKEKYRLVQKQITEYNKTLMEGNLIKKYNNLEAMSENFDAYPAFWYQLGSVANSIYRSDLDQETKDFYAKKAIECFKKYDDFNQYGLLRNDVIKASWALEYLEVLGLNRDNDPEKARRLIKIAEDNAGGGLDIIELCAFAYLRLYDYENASRLFHRLVNNGYNTSLNTQILSGLYIYLMRSKDSEIANEAKVRYKQLPYITEESFIIPIPDENVDLAFWTPDWNQNESMNEFLAKNQEESRAKAQALAEQKKKAARFYQRRIVIVAEKRKESYAQIYLGILDGYRKRIDERLPVASYMTDKEYESKKSELDSSGSYVIMVGDFKQSKLIYKDVKKNNWDFSKYGMNYVTHANKTVILVKDAKNKELDGLISYARCFRENRKFDIPDGVESAELTMHEITDDMIWDDVSDYLINGTALILLSPLFVVGGLLDGLICNGQKIYNLAKKDQITLLQYTLAFEDYLRSEDAIIDY